MALQASELSVGDDYERSSSTTSPARRSCSTPGASGDYNPLHTDELFATKVAGYPAVFAHGMLTMGMTGRCSPTTSATAASPLRRPLREPGVARRHADRHRRGHRHPRGGRRHLADLAVTTINQDGAGPHRHRHRPHRPVGSSSRGVTVGIPFPGLVQAMATRAGGRGLPRVWWSLTPRTSPATATSG